MVPKASGSVSLSSSFAPLFSFFSVLRVLTFSPAPRLLILALRLLLTPSSVRARRLRPPTQDRVGPGLLPVPSPEAHASLSAAHAPRSGRPHTSRPKGIPAK